MAILLQTRAQADLKKAVENISPLKRSSDKLKKNYIRRVKQFPALVMTVGLAQAVAFSQEKKGKEGALGDAHKKMLEHISGILGFEERVLVEKIQSASTLEYIHMTRRILSAWAYYRRFAVSLLDSDGTLQEQGEDE